MSETKMTKKENILQAVKFALFSASAGIIQIVSFTLLTELTDWRYMFCYLPSLVLSVLWNFTFNRRYTFKSATNIPIAMVKVAVFYLIFTPLSTLAGNKLEAMGVNDYIIQIGIMLTNLITEYLYCRFFVYKDSMNTRK